MYFVNVHMDTSTVIGSAEILIDRNTMSAPVAVRGLDYGGSAPLTSSKTMERLDQLKIHMQSAI